MRVACVRMQGMPSAAKSTIHSNSGRVVATCNQFLFFLSPVAALEPRPDSSTQAATPKSPPECVPPPGTFPFLYTTILTIKWSATANLLNVSIHAGKWLAPMSQTTLYRVYFTNLALPIVPSLKIMAATYISKGDVLTGCTNPWPCPDFHPVRF
jgi:hypothetical protein